MRRPLPRAAKNYHTRAIVCRTRTLAVECDGEAGDASRFGEGRERIMLWARVIAGRDLDDNGVIRWLDADFEIPARYTAGKNAITLKIEYISGKKPEWDEYYYWIYSYK